MQTGKNIFLFITKTDSKIIFFFVSPLQKQFLDKLTPFLHKRMNGKLERESYSFPFLGFYSYFKRSLFNREIFFEKPNLQGVRLKKFYLHCYLTLDLKLICFSSVGFWL